MSLETDAESTKGKRHVIANYITRNLRTHNMYVYKFIFCEFLNLVNIVGQMYLMDVFFNGHFTSYGSDILRISNMDAEKRVDPMAKVFPKMAKCKKLSCTFMIQNDKLCILQVPFTNMDLQERSLITMVFASFL